jgi:hypothetical protein
MKSAVLAVDVENESGFRMGTPVRTISYDSLPSTLPEVANIATQTDDLDSSESTVRSTDGDRSGSSFMRMLTPMDAGTESATSAVNFSVYGKSALVEIHRLGQCKPCNYFWHKVDGCRQGSDCTYCHFCPKSEIKKRKKDKVRQLRKAGVLRR